MRTRQLIGAALAAISLVSTAGAAGAAPAPGRDPSPSPSATAAAATATGFAATSIANGPTPQQLASALVGDGITISNVTYTGTDLSAGSFANGEDVVGFDTGIVLGSGRVQTAPDAAAPCDTGKGVEGPNQCDDNTTVLETPGDPDLTALSEFTTYDATVLEFDFVPAHSTAQFSYVFGSDEYPEYANSSYNDVFGFFVNGTNCAVVPGTDDPVSINTINNGDPGGDPTPHNEHLYRDNPTLAPVIDTELDGLTVPLTCDAAVTAGAVNHLKLAIADASDAALDSYVLLQGGSFVSGTQIDVDLSGAQQSGDHIEVPTGTAVSATATLAGTNSGSASGTATYKVYKDPACTTLFANAGTVSVTNGSVAPATPVTLTAAGTYYWVATYGGDSSHNSAVSGCGDATAVAVTSSQPTGIGVTVSGGGSSGTSITVPTGTAVTAMSKLSGANAATAGGSTTYTVFRNAFCTAPAFANAGTVTVANGQVPASTPVTLAQAGSYWFVASYSGDAKNGASTSPCNGAVAVTVTTPTAMSMTLAGDGRSGATLSVYTGTPVSGRGTLTGSRASTASGSAAYSVFKDSSCKTFHADAGTVAVTNGVVGQSNAITFANPGTYYWTVRYLGDANNSPSQSRCRGSFVVVHTPPPPPDCVEDGLDATRDVVPGPVSGTVHDAEPGVDDVTGLGDTVHDVNCDVVEPTEDGVDSLLGTTNPPPPPPPPPAPPAPPARVADGDYDGDGDSDIALFRPSTGTWHVRGLANVKFGAAGDIPVPGDYDNDGDIDRAVFRPSTNTWHIPGMATLAFGAAGDEPVPGDYDGDGDTELGVFRPSANTWHIQGRATVAWGASGDIPVPADYDGDGDTDIAVFRPSAGTWHVPGIATTQWGTNGDKPLPADYDGDGDMDMAVFRPSTATWHIRGIANIQYGSATDIPAHGDYDGDGDTDLATFRPSAGTWHIRGLSTVSFGTNGDIPVLRTIR